MIDYHEKWRDCADQSVRAGNLIRTYDRVLQKIMGGVLSELKRHRAEKNYEEADKIREMILSGDILLSFEEDGTIRWMVSGSAIGGEL